VFVLAINRNESLPSPILHQQGWHDRQKSVGREAFRAEEVADTYFFEPFPKNIHLFNVQLLLEQPLLTEIASPSLLQYHLLISIASYLDTIRDRMPE
jgi:hypothetical protein